MQFTELVLLLSAEQQAEVSIEEGVKNAAMAQDRKLILKRDRRFQANKAELLD